MTTIVEHIFSYQLDNLDAPPFTVERLCAHVEGGEISTITVSWTHNKSENEYVVFEYSKEEKTFAPVSSNGQSLCIGGRVEPREYDCISFLKLLDDACYIRFKHRLVLDAVCPGPGADIYTTFAPNYPVLITKLEEKGLVTTVKTTGHFYIDPRKFTIKGDSETYEVDCLGTSLFVDLSHRIEQLYLSSFRPSTHLKS